MKLIIGSDHAGFKMKEFLKQFLLDSEYEIHDLGVFSEDSMDYPDIAHPLAEAIAVNKYDFGILLCGSGQGMSIAANRHKNVRCALCWNAEIAKLSRQHNNANILSLPARFIYENVALEITKEFLNTPFEGGRHQKRIDKLNEC